MTGLKTYIHKDLIELSKADDSAAQYRLYKLYAKAMFNVAMRIMNSREEAEDMLQDSFVDAFGRLSGFRYESSFGSWLKRIVINHCLNELKRKKAELHFFDDMSIFDKNTVENEKPKGDVLNVSQVREAMEQLPNGARMIFSLYLLEGYDHVEISQILSISESNSKSQYMRAKRKVKEILTTQGYEAG